MAGCSDRNNLWRDQCDHLCCFGADCFSNAYRLYRYPKEAVVKIDDSIIIMVQLLNNHFLHSSWIRNSSTSHIQNPFHRPIWDARYNPNSGNCSIHSSWINLPKLSFFPLCRRKFQCSEMRFNVVQCTFRWISTSITYIAQNIYCTDYRIPPFLTEWSRSS